MVEGAPVDDEAAGRLNVTHGGDVESAVRQFGIAREQWLDLSTGIAPWSWPVPAVPAAVWQRLPAVECPLQASAARHYGCAQDAVLAVPGSQFAIQTLPQLMSPVRVAMPVLGYFEHRRAWQAAGHQLLDYTDDAFDQLESWIRAGEVDVVLVINPNNPTTTIVDKSRLQDWCDLLTARGGYLIVDEAFLEGGAIESMAPECPRPGLVVLRSIGKFFGLAGLRLGFVLTEARLKLQLQQRLGPWAVNGPAQYVGVLALQDRDWQQRQQLRIRQALSAQLELLGAAFDTENAHVKAGPLFLSVFLPEATAQAVYERLAGQGVLVRRFVFKRPPGERMSCLRFGLAKDTDELLRLQNTLQKSVTGL